MISFAVCLTALSMTSAVSADDKSTHSGIKLYTLDCGTLFVPDLNGFSIEGRLAGMSTIMSNPCFLIRHPKGDLLWDLGYQESLADKVDGVTFYGAFHKSMAIKLSAQLAQLGLSPKDIDFVAISHLHDDHIGNANLFSESTFIANEQEHASLFSAESRATADNFSLYSALEKSKTVLFKDSYDVFGDGSALIEKMPGHTLGSAVLLLKLHNSGAVLLSGDLYTHAKAREMNLVPRFSMDKKKILASRIRFEALAKEEAAKVIIQHEKSDFEALPRFPGYLD